MDTTRVIEMISRGYSQTVVASALGVSDGYISQLLADPQLREQISAKRIEYLERHVEADDSIDSLESKALARMHQLLPMITDPMKALRIYEVANKATRKTKEPTAPADSRGVTVNITLPEILAVQLKMSGDKQVVEVDGRSLATLPSNVLTNRLQDRKAAVPQISDAISANSLLSNLSSVPVPVRNVLQPQEV